MCARPTARGRPAKLISAAGRVTRALDLPLDDGAATAARTARRRGWCWRGSTGAARRDRTCGGTRRCRRRPTLNPPAVVPLTGAVQTLRFSPPEPLMLHVRTSTPVVTLLKRGDAAPVVEVHATGTMLDAYLGEEPAQLGLRAIGGGSSSGPPRSHVTGDAHPRGSRPGGPARRRRHAPFSFKVKQAGRSASACAPIPMSSIARCSTPGNRLGSGVVQMPTLKPGTYCWRCTPRPPLGRCRRAPPSLASSSRAPAHPKTWCAAT